MLSELAELLTDYMLLISELADSLKFMLLHSLLNIIILFMIAGCPNTDVKVKESEEVILVKAESSANKFTFCQICQRDLSHLSLQLQTDHINQCIDLVRNDAIHRKCNSFFYLLNLDSQMCFHCNWFDYHADLCASS